MIRIPIRLRRENPDFSVQGLDNDLTIQTKDGKTRYSPCYFFLWTLTHPIANIVPFKPPFETTEQLKDYVVCEANKRWRDPKQVPFHPLGFLFHFALNKILEEWAWWWDFIRSSSLVAEDRIQSIDEKTADNWLMQFIRDKIIERDLNMCYCCHSLVTSKTAEVHHIIYKGRLSKKIKGKSVPTNLITLCKICHEKMHQE